MSAWVTHEQQNDIVLRYVRGESIDSIIERHRVTRETVRRIARSYGIPPRKPKPKPKPKPHVESKSAIRRARADEMVARYVAGEKVAAIAARYGMSTRVVRWHVKRCGVPPRPTGRPSSNSVSNV